MKHILAILMMLAPLLPAAAAQTSAPQTSAPASETEEVQAAPVTEPKPATVVVTLQTSAGSIVLELEKERAPITTAAFLRNADAKRYDGGTFYRALDMAENFGLIQGGIAPLKPGEKLPPTIEHEPTTQTGLAHKTGAISMARAEPGSARTDFFIVVGDMTSLDAQPEKPGDNLGFAAFGHVVEGMDVVLKIMRAPISSTLGEKEGMKGQMLADPVKIISIRRTPPAPAGN